MNWYRHFLCGIGGSHASFYVTLRSEAQLNRPDVCARKDWIARNKWTAAGN
jgi:hypothetical protein